MRGRHQPHLTLASLLEFDLEAVRAAVADLPEQTPLPVRIEGLGMFRRSRCWLAPVASETLLALQCETAEAVRRTGALLHRNYEPGTWMPHVTLAPRLHLEQLATVAKHTFDVLPLDAVLDRTALIDTRIAQTLGLKPGLAQIMLVALVAVAITASFRSVGTLLVVGMLLAPVVAAKAWVNRIPAIMAVASGIGILSVAGGLLISWYAQTAAGPSISCLAIGLAGISALMRRMLTRSPKSHAITDNELPLQRESAK